MKNNSKRIAAAVLAFCITAGAMPTIEHGTVFPTAYAAEEEGVHIEKDGMLYIEYSDHISLIYCEPDGEVLMIPEMIDGKPVTEIVDCAFVEGENFEFFEIPALPERVKRVVIPESVKYIGARAFSVSKERIGLEEVILPGTLKEIGRYAFEDNKRLIVYGLPETAKVDPEAFAGTRFDVYERSNIIEKNGMIYKEYSDHITLYYCEPEGDTLYIPDMIDGKPVTAIWGFWYYEVNDLPYLGYLGITIPALPDSVKKAYIPEGVETVYGDCFACPDDKEGLYEVYLPSTLKEVTDQAFWGNHHLNVYGLPETAEVDPEAFAGTRFDVYERSNIIEKNGMIYKEYPDHITLYYCEPEGDTLYIPDMIDGKPVTEIRYFWRDESIDLPYLDYLGGITIPALPDSVKKVYIPEGVETLNGDCFACPDENEGLYEVYLPSTLKKVWEGSFNNNKHLNVYGLPETAEVDHEAFAGTRFNVEHRSNFVQKNGMVYEEFSDHITLNYCEPDGDTLYIPDMIDGKPVTAIYGFWYYESIELPYLDYLGITIPVLPDSVKKAYIPEGVEIVYGDSFLCPDDKEGLYEVYLPSTLKEVWWGAFNHNRHLNVYGLPETAEVHEDCNGAFAGTSFYVENRSNYVQKNGMIYWEYMDHISIVYCEPDGDTIIIPDMIDGKPVTEVNRYAFSGLSVVPLCAVPTIPENVKKIVVPDGVKVYGETFEGTPYEGQFTTTPVSDVMYGDANLDGKVTLADSLAILQFIANEDKYPLSEQAQKNADCYNTGDGITAMDAVAVMRLDTKIVSKLPIIEK